MSVICCPRMHNDALQNITLLTAFEVLFFGNALVAITKPMQRVWVQVDFHGKRESAVLFDALKSYVIEFKAFQMKHTHSIQFGEAVSFDARHDLSIVITKVSQFFAAAHGSQSSLQRTTLFRHVQRDIIKRLLLVRSHPFAFKRKKLLRILSLEHTLKDRLGH